MLDNQIAHLKSSFNNLLLTNGRTFFARSAAYAAYATPTDMFSIRNPAASGKIVVVRNQSMLVNTTAAALMKFFWFRRTALNTLGTPTDLTPVKYDSAQANAVAVPRVYGAAPTINDASAVINQQSGTTTVVTAAPFVFNSSGLAFGWAFNATDFACPVILHEGEELAINLAGAVLPGGFVADCLVSWMEFE